MMVVWVVVTAPHMPSLRGILSLFQLAWGIHFFLVVRTQYSRLALKLAPPEAAPLTVPPNTPARRHRRWRRRLDPGCQPPIRTLLGAALRLHRDEEDEDKPIRVVVSGNGSVDGGGEEDQTCYRRRGRRTLPPEGGRPEGRPDARHILLHTADREARRTVERRTRHSHHDHHDCSADEDAGRCEAITGDHGEAVPVLFWIPKRPPLTPMDPIPTTPLTHTPSPPNPTNTPPPTSPTIPSKSSHRD
ncbi:hypothetical protein GWK47_013104 [Chionoecetes opilio]|uniref:Uncharacterized protein n=1 Tax=Chionoecetes opilio TaxID=41210 RepID=A0A8J4XY72_CHIOP|nr:hypothetical protein GWK47_013104 [Chionoecetes opilio]